MSGHQDGRARARAFGNVRLVAMALAGTAALAMASAANAVTYTFSSGTYQGGATSPNPLLAPDVLAINGAANKFFGAGANSFTNQSGRVDWSEGTLLLFGGGGVDNRSLWQSIGDLTMATSTGGGSFVNSGTFAKTFGGGVTDISVTSFTNSGTLDAQTGTIRLGSSNMAFDAGSVFTGAGTVSVASSATFNGGFTSANLDFTGGTYTGNAAVLNGTADFVAGSFTGGWSVATGATLEIEGAANKFFGAGTFTNDGTTLWTSGTLLLFGGGTVANTGTWNATGDNSLANSTGGGSFVNSGLLTKSSGGGVTDIGVSSFTNSGTINADTGTLRLSNSANSFAAGSAFTGAGTISLASSATFTGGFTSANLDFAGGNYTGVGATLSGSADFVAGNFTGDWTVASGASLDIVGAANKFFSAGSFVNSGAVNWTEATLLLSGGGGVTNAAGGTWTATGDNSLAITTGGGSFTNVGTFAKTSGGGITDIGVTSFVNSGILDAQTGTIRLGSSNMAINAGSVFTGAGTVNLASSATFNGGFTSANLDFTGGTYTGNAAVLNGAADFVAGTFAGGWTVASGATLEIQGAANKFFGAGSFVNAGAVNWSEATLLITGGGGVTNAVGGTWTATGDNVITVSTGGGTLVNDGLFQKTSGGGTTNLAAVLADNSGTIDVRSGTIQLPTNFANDGTLAGTGTFALSGTLTNNGTMAPGDGGAGIGALNLSGNYSQTALGSLSIQLSSIGAYDMLNVSGAASLAGSLSLSCASCTLNVGELYTLLDAAGDLTGQFGTVTTSGFNPGFTYALLYDRTLDRVQLRIDAVGDPAPPTGGVPEPATWASMILGFALIGGALRRRRVVAIVAA